MALKNAPATDGAMPPDPFDGDVYLVRFAASDGNMISRLFFNLSKARWYVSLVRDQGGTPTLHRTVARWGDCS